MLFKVSSLEGADYFVVTFMTNDGMELPADSGYHLTVAGVVEGVEQQFICFHPRLMTHMLAHFEDQTIYVLSQQIDEGPSRVPHDHINRRLKRLENIVTRRSGKTRRPSDMQLFLQQQEQQQQQKVVKQKQQKPKKPCFEWAAKGECSYGEKCRYTHVEN